MSTVWLAQMFNIVAICGSDDALTDAVAASTTDAINTEHELFDDINLFTEELNSFKGNHSR